MCQLAGCLAKSFKNIKILKMFQPAGCHAESLKSFVFILAYYLICYPEGGGAGAVCALITRPLIIIRCGVVENKDKYCK